VLKTVYRTIQKYDLIPPGSGVVIGVSGGVDSLALMHILYTLRERLSCAVYAATLDHGLRGEAGAGDADFVIRQAEGWGIPAFRGKADVQALAEEHRLGIEAAARLARYDFLAEAAQHFGVKLVAVAHHIGDQAETVLMHLTRGAGLHGLGGMQAKVAVPGHLNLTLIRPLLRVTRAEIEAYCREHSLIPRQDATNEDTIYLRNYIRHETLPHLERLNPNIQRVLAQLAETAQTEDDYLQKEVDAFIHEHVDVGSGRISIRRVAFSALHPALQRRLVVWGARQIRTEIESLTYYHITEAVEVGLGNRQGGIALLTKGVRLRVEYDTLIIEHETSVFAPTDQPLIPEGQEISVEIPGETVLPGGEWTLVATVRPEEGLRVDEAARLLIAEGSPVTLRGRHEGDRFTPLGMGGHSQKVNRWMINRKIPQRLRRKIPLICVGNEIAAISMDRQWFISERYALKDTVGQIVYLHFKKNL
jgi:tRNA(Ile)-lysidine synthetase-like protein